MPAPRWELRGLTVSRHSEDGAVAILVAYNAVVGNHSVFLLRSSAATTFISFLDDLTADGAAHRDLPIEREWTEDWEKYPDEFMTEPSARKYAKREMAALRETGAEREPYYTGDASLDVEVMPMAEAMKQTLRGEDPTGTNKPRPARKRFDDDDAMFGARFEQQLLQAEQAGRLPRPSMIGHILTANEDAAVAIVRMVNPDSAKGGKFWEIYVREMTADQLTAQGNGETRAWWVDVHFGALVDEENGSNCNWRNIAKCATKGMAMDVRRERINKQRKKGYNHVRLETGLGGGAS